MKTSQDGQDHGYVIIMYNVKKCFQHRENKQRVKKKNRSRTCYAMTVALACMHVEKVLLFAKGRGGGDSNSSLIQD